MTRVKLTFEEASDLDALLNDQEFVSEIEYFEPQRLDGKHILLSDPTLSNNAEASEEIVLTQFGDGLRRVLGKGKNSIEYKNSVVGEQKGGLVCDGKLVISSTDVERASVTIERPAS